MTGDQPQRLFNPYPLPDPDPATGCMPAEYAERVWEAVTDPAVFNLFIWRIPLEENYPFISAIIPRTHGHPVLVPLFAASGPLPLPPPGTRQTEADLALWRAVETGEAGGYRLETRLSALHDAPPVIVHKDPSSGKQDVVFFGWKPFTYIFNPDKNVSNVNMEDRQAPAGLVTDPDQARQIMRDLSAALHGGTPPKSSMH